jgi:hypothetical protein
MGPLMRIGRFSAVALVVALASGPSAQQSAIHELRAALDRCMAQPINPRLIPSELCWGKVEAVARAIAPQACATDTLACAELEEKIANEADIRSSPTARPSTSEALWRNAVN